MGKCKIEGCNNEVRCKGMCKNHYEKERRHNEKGISRTVYDSNEIILFENHAEIVIYNKKCEEIDRAIIDLEDVEKVKKYKWCKTSKGYILSNDKKLLHRYITNCPENMTVDHINKNKLDNRKSNLRICTMQENDFNKPILKNNTSGVAGVSRTKNGTWRAYISLNRKQINLGHFKNKEDAIKARKNAEIKYFGEFRNIEN